MDGINLYRPRWAAEIAVPSPNGRKVSPDASELIRIPLNVIRFTLEKNDRNHADSCRLTCDWKDTGFDPRLLSNGTISFWIDNADDQGAWTPTEDNIRFLGIVMECEKRSNGDGPPVMEILAHDYTALLLGKKPFPSDFVPRLSMDLREAWQLICDGTGWYSPDEDKIVSTVSALRDALRFSPDIPEPPSLSRAVPTRLAKLDRVATHPGSDAWSTWQSTVGTIGLLSWIDRDQVHVSTVEGYYTKSDPPVMITGKNVSSWKEQRRVQSFANRGIAVVSFSPFTGQTIEVLYPPQGDARVTRKRARAATAKPSRRPPVATDVRDTFPIPGITDPAVLGDVARMIYEERSRQELAGTIETKEMVVKTRSGADFDLLDLTHGDDIEINVDDGDRRVLATLAPFLRRQYLQDKGYSEEIATIMAAAADDPVLCSYRFYVHRATVEGDADAPSFGISIDYVNKIHLPGIDDGEVD